jgi:hypothetical protein
MSKLDTTSLNPNSQPIIANVSDRTARAAKLVAKHDAMQKEIIDFMQEDDQIKQAGWQGSPYSYLQYTLAKWAAERLK